MSFDFPTIEDDSVASVAAPPAASTAIATAAQTAVELAKVDLKAVALAQFGDWRADVANVKAKLTGVVHDLSTGVKLTEAKALRQRLINAPRAEARKTATAVKARLTSVGRDVSGELETIEAAYAEAEKLISPQIEARDKELAEERRIKEEKEAARVQAHRDNLAKLAAFAEHAKAEDMTAERIANGIAIVKAIEIDPKSWEEFAQRARDQKDVTIERMELLHAQAVAREAAAARAAAEKEEADRKAAELRAQEERLAAERAELERQKAELKAAQDRAAAEAQAKPDADAAPQKQMDAPQAGPAGDGSQKPNGDATDSPAEAGSELERQAPQPVLKAEAATPDATNRGEPAIASPSVGSMGAGQAADAAPAAGGYTPSAEQAALIERGREIVNDIIAAEVLSDAIADTPSLSLGTIKERIAPLSITAEGLAYLGYPATKVKATCFYRESDWSDIKAALRRVLT